MTDRPRPLLDLLQSSPLTEKILDNARKTVRTHVLDSMVGDAIEARVDQVLGRVRKR